jgi:cytochrome c oxidase assembly protein subunit 15
VGPRPLPYPEPVTTSTHPAVDAGPPEPADGSLDGRAPLLARRVYAANLVAQMGIVVTGAVVRLTSSGLGCPSWPRCTGASLTPVADQPETWHKYVEFGNRMLTGVLIALAIAALVLAVLDARRRRGAGLVARPALTWLAAVPMMGTAAQIPLGGVTVLTGLNPVAVGSHLLLSMGLVGLVTVLVRRAGEPSDEPVTVVVRREIRVGVAVLTAVMGAVLVAGMLVTASGPHAGDSRTHRLDLDPQQLSWLHADLVVLCIGLLGGLLVALRATDAPERTRSAATVLLAAFLGQGLVGYVQYFTGEPWAVAVHVLGATVVWWSAVRLLLSTRTRGVVA